MAYEGWLSFGGVEIVNNERIRGYSRSADCYLPWLQGPECETLQEAMGDTPYVIDDITSAPWYDQSLPTLSGRFLGVYGLALSGMDSSTRSTQSTEGISDGGVLGTARKGMLSARVTATLLAEGRDALDYGVSWLNSALDANRCGQHGGSCGTTDMEFLTDCPPERADVNDYGPWVEQRRNMVERPIPVEDDDWGGLPGAELDFDVAYRAGGVSLRRTMPASDAMITQVVFIGPQGIESSIPVTAGETYSASFYATSSIPFRSWVGFYWYDVDGDLLDATQGEDISSSAGEWVRPFLTAVPPAGAVRVVPVGTLAPDSGTAPAGTEGWVMDPLLEQGDEVLEFFAPGVISDTESEQYVWTGEADESASVWQTREVNTRPQTDEEYAESVNPYRRFMHDVSVTSGPIPIDYQTFRSPAGYYGVTMEWTITSERAWVYSVTRPVNLPVTPTIVVEDTPYNLAPYPSAELGGVPVLLSVNYSTNPSVETDATEWSAVTDGSSFAPGTVTSGRIAGELAAVGTASYRAVLTTPFAGTGTNGWFGIEQEVDVSERPDLSRVSFNVWSAQVLVSGTANRGDTEVYALWRSEPGGEPMQTEMLGTIPPIGGALSVKSVLPPEGATHVLVRVQAPMTSWSAGAVIRLYADALAVTVP